VGHRHRPEHHHRLAPRRPFGGGPHPDGGRRPLRIAARTVAWVATALIVIVTLVRLTGTERATLVPIIAFTPVIAVVGAIVAVAAFAARARVAAAVALVAVLALGACIVPRAVADGPHPDGPTLRVMTVNLYKGEADPQQVVRRVIDQHADVLVVQELTAAAGVGFSHVGLDQILPYSALATSPSSDGTGIYSRLPLVRTGMIHGVTGRLEVRARVSVPGAAPLTIQAVHTESPDLRRNGDWRATLRQLPHAVPGRTELLVGDFNASLDHGELRRVISHGWADAAERSGKGLRGTWPARLPIVALDHVLTSRQIGVQKTKVFRIGGTDHRMVFAVLELPRG
jgi:endonuclease/exonuclease/phosphatase (EEP) superfamily protein YafD